MNSETKILSALSENGEMYGLELVLKGCGNRGTIYVTLGRMEDEGKIKSRIDPKKIKEPRLPRRLYSISEGGKFALCDLNWAETV